MQSLWFTTFRTGCDGGVKERLLQEREAFHLHDYQIHSQVSLFYFFIIQLDKIEINQNTKYIEKQTTNQPTII